MTRLIGRLQYNIDWVFNFIIMEKGNIFFIS